MSEASKQDVGQETARRNWPEPVSRAGSLAGAAFARAGFRDPTLVLRWAEIVGPDVARFAEPFRLSEGPSGGVLTLRAEPAAAVFLQHQTRSLCERINTFLGRQAIVRLRFVQGEIAARPERTPLPRLPAAPPADDPVNGFAGPDRLKATLVSLARARKRPVRD